MNEAAQNQIDESVPDEYFKIETAINIFLSRDYSGIAFTEVKEVLENLRGIQNEDMEEKIVQLKHSNEIMKKHLTEQMDLMESGKYLFVLALAGVLIGGLASIALCKRYLKKDTSGRKAPSLTEEEYEDIMKQEQLIKAEREKLEKKLNQLKGSKSKSSE